MAIGTEQRRRCVAGCMPIPNNNIDVFDRRQIAGNYRGFPAIVSISGGLTPTGAITRVLEMERDVGGVLTPTGDPGPTLTMFRSLEGGLTPTGDMVLIMVFPVSVGGTLTTSGSLKATNPDWLLIDEVMVWMGEWDETYSYSKYDTILYQTSDSADWHVFVSRTSHNVGNVPTTEPIHWARLFQEQWL